ncbi:4-coumarate-CoA ligase-like protein [Xylogone sp. PMI_703]|nr:4-coumarate-CoA ligase-like protein [Xylogone sp. PMI_703]
MPYRSKWTIPIEVCSFHSYLFGNPGDPLPDTPAFLDADRPDTHFLTVNTFRLWSQRFAAGLQKAGLQPGDRVLLFSGNNIFFPVVFLGVLMAGGIFTGANPANVARELAYQLKDSESKFLLCANESLDTGIEAAKIAGMTKDQVFIFDDEVISPGGGPDRLGVRNWKALVEGERVGERFRWAEVQNPKEQTCCLNYSSGTTGVPKGVEITHYNYVANAKQMRHLGERSPKTKALGDRARWLCYLPMYHAMAQTAFIADGAKRRIPVYVMKKFDFIKMLENVQKYKITSLAAAPPIVVALAKHPASRKYDLSTVVDVTCGAAPLSGEVMAEAEKLWPSGTVKIRQGWGMTEATCSVIGNDPSRSIDQTSVGELNANCIAKIMSEDGLTELPRGQRGEIWVQAPNVMKGYWRNEKATKETLIDGPDGRWLRTGDIAFVDNKDEFHIVDRIKELIKVKGNQVAPAELEALLLQHPQVADVGVIGVTINGEEYPRAYIVQRQGEKADEKEIAEWLAKRVSRHKKLVGGVAFIDAIPKNPSGKILRRFLREKAKKEVGDSRARL